MIQKKTDILVIGSGIAGLLSTQMLAESNYEVMIATDTNVLGGGASYFPLKATLGIQTSAENNNESFEEDFNNISGGKIDREKMAVYINESFGKEQVLTKIGLSPQLRNDKRPACFAKHHRPIYLIKDWEASRNYVTEKFTNTPNITILYQSKAIKLFSENNQITGALLFSQGEYVCVNAKVVILATGGVAGLYQDNLYPSTVDGSGWVLASDIGAELINTSFIQFIPSFLKPKYKTLFGEHTIKYLKNVYNDQGQDIFSDLSSLEKEQLFFERSAYAPFSIDFPSSLFDIRIFNAIKNGSKGVKFEYKPEIYQDNEAFYKIYLDWLSNNQKIDLLNDEIVISHFAHATNGGIKISINGQSSVENLYVLGEASCGVEGANRMGGNSVGGIVVFTPRAVSEITQKLSKIQTKFSQNIVQQSEQFINKLKNQSKQQSLEPNKIKARIGEILQQNASIVRNQKDLHEAKREIMDLEKQFSIFPNHETLEGFNAYFALKTSNILISQMIEEPISVGAHYKAN